MGNSGIENLDIKETNKLFVKTVEQQKYAKEKIRDYIGYILNLNSELSIFVRSSNFNEAEEKMEEIRDNMGHIKDTLKKLRDTYDRLIKQFGMKDTPFDTKLENFENSFESIKERLLVYSKSIKNRDPDTLTDLTRFLQKVEYDIKQHILNIRNIILAIYTHYKTLLGELSRDYTVFQETVKEIT